MRIMFLSQSPKDSGDAEKHERTQNLLRGYASPGTELDLCYPDDFPGAKVFEEMGRRTFLSGLHHTVEAPALIKKIVWAEEQGYDAVVQSNTFDPAVEAARLAVSIPVIGPLRTTLHVAATLATRVGVIVPLEGHVPYTWRLLDAYGMADAVTDIRELGIYGKDMRDRKAEIRAAALEKMGVIIRETGAECIIPLGGAVIPVIVSTEELQEELGLPVLNTKSIAIRFAEMCVDLGISHSPVAYPPAGLPSDVYTEYAFPRG